MRVAVVKRVATLVDVGGVDNRKSSSMSVRCKLV